MKSKFFPGFFKRFQLNIHKRYIQSEIRIHEIKYLFWECTLRCNLNCIHCGSDCHKESNVPDMASADFLNVTKQISKHYNPNTITVVLTGGEPLMRRDLESIGKQLNKQGYPWAIVSNGLMLSQVRFQQLLAAGLSSITISLDGLEDEHNWFRGSNKSFEKACEAIKMVTKHQQNIAFDVVTCVNQKNIHSLKALKNLLLDIGVKRWRIFTIFPIGRAKENTLLHLSSSQFTSLMDFILQSREEGNIEIKYGCEGFLGNYENQVRDGFFFCRAGVNIASVLADGSIGACPNINQAFTQGNIYEDDFMEVWKEKYGVFRNRKENLPEVCRSCNVKQWCLGSSMHLRDENNDLMRCHYKLLE